MQGKKVIVIDDDVDIQEAVKLTLEAEGLTVVTASDGTEGLGKLRSGGADLVILDVMMSRDTEGFQVAQEIKGDEALKAIPVLMMTSVAEKSGFKFDPKADGDFLPVEDYVEKPVDPAELVKRVRTLLGA